jgi:signal peptidase
MEPVSVAVRSLPLDGSTAHSLPAVLRIVGYLVLVVTTCLVVALATVPKLTPMRFYAVTTGSMVPTLPVGTVTVVDTHERAPRAGEIIAFHPPGDPTQVFTHRVVAVLSGGRFKTEGDALGSPDPWTVEPADVVGRVTARVPYAALALAFLKAAALLTLAAYVVRFVVRRGFAKRLSSEALVGAVLTGSLFYLFKVLRPVFGGSVAFAGLSRRAVRVDVVNTGWVPIHAFSSADPSAQTASIGPNSKLLTTLHFSHQSNIENVVTVKLVPALSAIDFVVMAVIVFSPFLLTLLNSRRKARQVGRIELRRG